LALLLSVAVSLDTERGFVHRLRNPGLVAERCAAL